MKTASLRVGRVTSGSIRRRLPLLIVGVVLIGIVGIGVAAYRELQQVLLKSQKDRLHSVSQQLATLVERSMDPRFEEAKRLGRMEEVRRAVTTPEPVASDAARRAILALIKANPQVLRVRAWNAAGDLRLDVASVTAGDEASPGPDDPGPPPEGISELGGVGDLVYFDVTSRIPLEVTAAAQPPTEGPQAGIAGYVTIRRALAYQTASVMIRRLLGEDAIVHLGSSSEGVWTDLSTVEPRPPSTPGAGIASEFRTHAGVDVVGASVPVQNTPWILQVTRPRDRVLVPARVFVQRMLGGGLLVVALAAGLGWWIARGVTRPLNELTQAAERIAHGDFARRVPTGRSDEIGRLAVAFNTMTTHVEEGYAQLEAKVDERTKDLAETLTALKDAQQQLVRRERLALLGQLAGGVGHELRNPLGVMTNAVYYLEMVQKNAPPEVLEYHGILRAQIGLAERIVSDLLDFARIKSPQRERTPLATILDDQLVRLPIPENVSVARDLPSDLPPVHIDPVQIGQIVLNLLLNAVQALETHGGTLTLRGRQLPDGNVALEVQDNGPGVPPDLQEKIFEALFTTKARGIGLGLAVSRSLAETNGGTLTVAPTPGGGATFTLVLPTGRLPEGTV